MIYRYDAKPAEAEFRADPAKYIITADTLTHRMGDITVNLPQNAYRIPLENDSDTMALCTFSDGKAGHSFFYHRIDEETENIPDIAPESCKTDALCKSCRQKKFLQEHLITYPGDLEYARTSFAYKDGVVYFLKTSSPSDNPYRVEYQSLYFPSGVFGGPAIVLNHSIDAPKSFCHRKVELPDIDDFSSMLYHILGSVTVDG